MRQEEGANALFLLSVKSQISNDFLLSHTQTKLNDVNKAFYEQRITGLKIKNLNEKNDKDAALPTYLKKRLKRFKSIYETVHNNKAYEKSLYYGHLEYIKRNEIPDMDFLTQLIQQTQDDKGIHKHYKKHSNLKFQKKIKKARLITEAGIMQRKLKI